jgi:hypothetical protein
MLFLVKYLIYLFLFFTKFLILLKNGKSIFIKKNGKDPLLKLFLKYQLKEKKNTLQPRSSYIQYKKI